MGTGRSGSTILEILLGHGADCIGAGELTSIVQDGFIDNKVCSCSKSFRECVFWSKILTSMALENSEITEWAYLQKKIDWHTGFLLQLFRLIPKREIDKYNEYNRKLLTAIREISGTKVIIDSSKYTGRALALSRLSDIELCVVCLTRSPEGLMASFQKPNKDEQPPKKPWAVFRYYASVLSLLRVAVTLVKCKVIFLRYEDMLSRRGETLADIEKAAGINLSASIECVEHNKAFDVGHLITGNRLRKNKQVKFNKQENDEVQQHQTGQIQIALMKLVGRLWGFR